METTHVSDALDTLGMSGQVQSLQALVAGKTCIGPAYTVRFELADRPVTAPAADYLNEAPAGSVIVIDNAGRIDCTVWGGLMTTFAQLRNMAGTVIWGVCRDIGEIRERDYPMFALRSYMRTGKGRVRLAEVGGTVQLGGLQVSSGDMIVADDDGVVCVAAEYWPAVTACAEEISAAEARIHSELLRGVNLAQARQQHGYNNYRIGAAEGE